MDLHRGILANLDRRLLAELDQDELFQMVRVPVSPAKWSTWKRYCGSAGTSMGRAISALIDRELADVAETPGCDSSLLTQQVTAQLAKREADVARREKAADMAEERLGVRSEHLRRWEIELQTLVHRVPSTPRLVAQPDDSFAKVGRNERCPCGSGLKYKHCHGLALRQPNDTPR